MGLFGGNSSDKYARRAEQRELERQQRIEQGTKHVRQIFNSQFGDSYYDELRQKYMDFHQPQLNQQFGNQQGRLLQGLARNGLFQGRFDPNQNMVGTLATAGSIGMADLEKQMANQTTGLVARAQQSVDAKKGAIQNAQDAVLGQLQVSADASGAAADAASRSNILAAQTDYEPLGQVFTDASSLLATQADLERRGLSQYNTGLFSPGAATKSGSGANITG